MSEVKRYDVLQDPEDYCDCGNSSGSIEVESSDGEYVRASAYDSALLELSALREELSTTKGELDSLLGRYSRMWDAHDKCAERLTAAEQRNADQLKLIAGLVEYADSLLADVNNAWSYAGSTGTPETHKDDDYAAAVALIAKPTESGASE